MPTVPVSPSGAAAAPAPPWKLPARVYLALGVVGVAAFVAGIWMPLLAHVPAASVLRIVLAIAGGLLAVVGLGRWNILRRYERGGRGRSEAEMKEAMPSLQFFSPPAPPRRPPPGNTAPSRALGPTARRAVLAGGIALVVLTLLVATIPLPTPAGAGSTGGGAPALPTASVSIRCNPPLYPIYTSVDGLNPPLPNYALQTPCKVNHDEVHATFSSRTGASGEEVEFPIRLPGNGSVAPGSVYADAYLGMVVAGDTSSVDNQSYAELVMTPGSNGTGVDWDLTVAIWSLLLNTTCGVGLNFTFQNQYGCIVDDAAPASATLASGLPGDVWANVTFTGALTGSSGDLLIDFNDSSNSSASASYRATAAKTGSYAFHPYYTIACPDACDLNWSEPFGLGLGLDLCDTPGSCFSYNATAAADVEPFAVGSPESWNGLAFADDYEYVSFESSTGACGGVSGVAPCSLGAEEGEYPAFTFNGTALEFGGNYSFATETFGGAYHEFNAYATSTDYTPLFVDELTNSSAAGYLAPGDRLNVSARVQDLGSLEWENLSYAEPGEAAVNESMTLVAGSPSDGIYNGSVPVTGTNGTIAFRVVVTNRAGVTVSVPPAGSASATVERSALPDVTAVLGVQPAACGGIALAAGAPLPNGTSVVQTAGFYPIRATGCYSYTFAGWSTSGGISIVGADAATSTVAFHANGTVTAEFRYRTPYDTVGLAFSPSTCGVALLNGTVIGAPGDDAIALLQGGPYGLAVISACSGESFSGWAVSNAANLTILGPNLTVEGNGTVTATFVPSASAASLTLATDPGTCGGVRVGSAAYVTGESIALTLGTAYPVGPDACGGYGYAQNNASTTGGASLSHSAVTLSGDGGLAFAYYKLTLVNIETDPTGCGGIDWDNVLETTGAVLNVTNHTVNSVLAEPCAGDYLEGLSVLGNLTLEGAVVVVNGPGTVLATFEPGPEEFWVGFITDPISCGAIVLNGTPYGNSQYTYLLPGSVQRLSVDACSGYGFVGWTVGGTGITLAASDGSADNLAFVNGSGSLEAIFHPLVAVDVETDPVSCGAVALNGVDYPDGASAELPEGNVYSVAAVPCDHYVFSAWETSGGGTISAGNLTLSAPVIVAAIFVPALYAVRITIDPAACGPVLLGGVQETNDTTVELSAGSYALGTTPCTGFELLGWSTDSGLSVSGSSLLVNGAGNLTEDDGPVPPVVALAAPGSAATGVAISFSVTVAVPVPPYNYTYRWSFGDGTSATTPSNFTTHTYARTGTYEVTVIVTDPYGRTAESFANVSVVSAPAGPSLGLGTLGLVILVAGIAAVAAGAAVAVVRARRPARPGPDEDAPTGEGP